MTETITPGPHGPLATVLEIRRGPDDAHTGGLEHREALIYTLGQGGRARAPRHAPVPVRGVLAQAEGRGGADARDAGGGQRWRKTLLEIGAQEMLHLALVQNLLTAVGAAPRLARPNFPMPAYAYPAGVRIELVPFGEAALRHFAFLERPDGMAVDDARGVRGDRAGRAPCPMTTATRSCPSSRSSTRSASSTARSPPASSTSTSGSGTERLFVGPPSAQATEEHFRWPSSSRSPTSRRREQAIDTIVEQGEGARGDWRDAHFGRLLGILDEYLALKQADPSFEPARPVVMANVRPQSTGVLVPLITDPGTTRAMDLLNVSYEVLLQLLSRYFAPTDETPGAARGAGQRVGGAHVLGDQAAGQRRHHAAGRVGAAGSQRRSRVRAVLRGGLPPASPRGRLGPDGGAAAGCGGLRPAAAASSAPRR